MANNNLDIEELSRLGIYESWDGSGYTVTVYDQYGPVRLCRYSKEKDDWLVCVYDTVKEAIEARNRYYGIESENY